MISVLQNYVNTVMILGKEYNGAKNYMVLTFMIEQINLYLQFNIYLSQ